MTAANDLTEETLRDLAQTKAQDETVLSLYLDLDPERFATAPTRASEIDSVLDGAHREIESGERSHAERQALRAALEHARGLLEEQSWAHGARALAVFLCEPLGLSRTLRLPHPVVSAFVISDEPFIAPLTESGPVGRVCVALVDERSARILRGSAERLHEVLSVGDDVHGRQDQGGWSQARYQRSRHEEVKAHLRHVARTLRLLLQVTPYDRLLIACTEQLWPRVVEELTPDVRALLHDERLSLDVGHVGIEDVVRATEAVLAEEHRAHEAAALAELREHHARDGGKRAAVGLEQVLDALVERRVGTLLYLANLHPSGVLCPRCGWMGVTGDSCPVDGSALEQRPNILEDAVQSAVSQSAEVLPLRDRPELEPFGGIAATLRF
ncbi:MAG TPA: Vms1/Ankzf1 family peptidyl-tRNA hydrolase [Solirubrobacteraceae bacterium]|nr:Vms1/Ankzf1 family peptidyl-tRNA hydrolase [Solirubrobacteraceae bacterium]HME04035.1 Vms1/Ankzf1 family peptidyl-tRNA hydrolase [Solirubrobacteraceae bacterium]